MNPAINKFSGRKIGFMPKVTPRVFLYWCGGWLTALGLGFYYVNHTKNYGYHFGLIEAVLFTWASVAVSTFLRLQEKKQEIEIRFFLQVAHRVFRPFASLILSEVILILYFDNKKWPFVLLLYSMAAMVTILGSLASLVEACLLSRQEKQARTMSLPKLDEDQNRIHAKLTTHAGGIWRLRLSSRSSRDYVQRLDFIHMKPATGTSLCQNRPSKNRLPSLQAGVLLQVTPPRPSTG